MFKSLALISMSMKNYLPLRIRNVPYTTPSYPGFTSNSKSLFSLFI